MSGEEYLFIHNDPIAKIVVQRFVQEKLCNSCLGATLICLEAMALHGIAARAVDGYSIRYDCQGFYAIRHVWVFANGCHMDLGHEIDSRHGRIQAQKGDAQSPDSGKLCPVNRQLMTKQLGDCLAIQHGRTTVEAQHERWFEEDIMTIHATPAWLWDSKTPYMAKLKKIRSSVSNAITLPLVDVTTGPWTIARRNMEPEWSGVPRIFDEAEQTRNSTAGECPNISRPIAKLGVAVCNVMIDGFVQQWALIDTGASHCMISGAVFEKYRRVTKQNLQIRSDKISFRMLNGETTLAQESTILKFHFGLVDGLTKDFSQKFHIVNGLGHPLIIGIDFLGKHKGVIDVSAKILRLGVNTVRIE